MRKIFCLVMLFLFLIGTIGGIGAAGIAVLSFMAWPTAVKFWKELND